MPRVKLDPHYRQKCNRDMVKAKMAVLNVSGTDLARAWKVEPQTANYRIRTQNMSYMDASVMFRVLEFTEKDILKFMKGDSL